jgi:hypothetical protein
MADFLSLSSFTGVTAKYVSGWSSTSPHSNLMHETTDIMNLWNTNKWKFTAQQCHGKMLKSRDISDKQHSKASNAVLLT